MTDIKTILTKGKLTGEEVGRILLRDYARFLLALQSEQTPPKEKFTNAEKQVMVNGITDPYEIRQYNTFIGILQFLQKTAIFYSEQYRQLKYLLLALYREIDQAKHIGVVRPLLAATPLILTEPQYRKLKKEDLEAKLSKKTSIGGIILTATEYYLTTYLKGGEYPDIYIKEGGETPYNGLFEAYKDKPLTNPEFKRFYWREGVNGHYETPDGKRGDKLPKNEWLKEISKWHAKEVETGEEYIKWVNDSREAPADATKHNILEYLGNYLKIGERTTAKDLETFKNDYPDIYEAILTEIKGVKGLTLPEDYTDPAISYKTLYELDLPYYRQFFRFNPKDGEAFIASFISIIPEEELKYWSKWRRERYLDEQGNYKYQLSDHEEKELTEQLPATIERVKQHLKQLFAMQEIYRILGEELGEDCITEFATDKNYVFKETDTDNDIAKKRQELGISPRGFLSEFIEVVNGELQDFKGMLRKTSLVIDQATIKEIHEAVNSLPLIEIKDLKPKKEAIAEVKELTKNDLGYYGTKGLTLFDILTGAICLTGAI